MKRSSAALISGNVLPMVLRMAFPMLLSMLGMMAFNLIDTFFIGLLGTDSLAAISFTFPVIMVVGSISLGIGTGVTSALSKAIGQGSDNSNSVKNQKTFDDKQKRLSTDSLLLALFIVMIVISIGLPSIDAIFYLLGASDEILPLIKEYMVIWYWGIPFLVVPMVGNSIIRSTGDTKTPSIIMGVALVMNTILDPIFIFGFGPVEPMGLAGAAWATVISRMTTLVVSILILHYRERLILWKIPRLQETIQSWKIVLYIGLIAAATNLINPVTVGVITKLVANYGKEAVAAMGVSLRIEMFSMTPIMALGSALAPFIGQNSGANKGERIVLALNRAYRIAILHGVVLFVLYFFIGDGLAKLFSDNPRVNELTLLYLRIVTISLGLSGSVLISSIAFNALHKPFHASIITLFRLVVIFIPLAIILTRYYGIAGIFYAAFFANTIAGIFAISTIQNYLSSKNIFGRILF